MRRLTRRERGCGPGVGCGHAVFGSGPPLLGLARSEFGMGDRIQAVTWTLPHPWGERHVLLWFSQEGGCVFLRSLANLGGPDQPRAQSPASGTVDFGARHLCVEDLEGDEKHSGLHPLGASSVHPTLTMTIKSIYRHYRISTGQRKCPSVRHSGPQAK